MNLTLSEQLKALSSHNDPKVIQLIQTIESLQDDLYCVRDTISESNVGILESFYDDFMGITLCLEYPKG